MGWAEDGRAAWVTPSRNDCVVTGGHTGHSEIRSALPCVIASFPVAPAVRNAWKVTTSGRPALVSTPAAAHAARASCTPRSCACTPRCSNAVASGAFSPHLRYAKGREQKRCRFLLLCAHGAKRNAARLLLFCARAKGQEGCFLMLPLFALRLWLRHQPHPGTAPYTRHTKARCRRQHKVETKT